jgi:hypothetical protein
MNTQRQSGERTDGVTRCDSTSPSSSKEHVFLQRLVSKTPLALRARGCREIKLTINSRKYFKMNLILYVLFS